MSVDTILKIALKCRRKFVVTQPGDSRPFIEEILENLPEIIRDLEPSQVETFYEAMATIIASCTDPKQRQALLFKLMDLPNQTWAQVTVQADNNIEVLWQGQTMGAVVMVLSTNTRVCQALGASYVVQLTRIYHEMLSMYKLYSSCVSSQVEKDGQVVLGTAATKQMRAVKKGVLRLIMTFVQSCGHQDKKMLMDELLPPLMGPVLEDYRSNHPAARDHEVMLLFSAVVDCLSVQVIEQVPAIMGATFECTLSMITENFEDFPDHRISFFKLLRSINTHCFGALLLASGKEFDLVMQSIFWAMKHIERNIGDTGLNILHEVILNFQRSPVANDFYKTYYLTIMNSILEVLTDSFHRPGFTMQVTVLLLLVSIVETGQVAVPLWTVAEHGDFQNNLVFVQNYVADLLGSSFKNLNQQQTQEFVAGLFKLHNDQTNFKEHVRDFLIQLKEVGKQGAGAGAGAGAGEQKSSSVAAVVRNAGGGQNNDDLYFDVRQKEQEERENQQKAYVDSVPGLRYVPGGDREVNDSNEAAPDVDD